MKKLLVPVGIILAIALSIALSVVAIMRDTPTVVQKDVTKVGSVASPDIPSPYFSFGDQRFWAGSTDSLTQASTTVCAIQSPAATSTLISAGIRFSFATTSAVIVDLAKSATQYATTTKIGSTQNIVGGAQATIVASTTGSVAGDATIFAPNNYFVVKMEGPYVNATTQPGNAPVGSCYAVWTEV